MDTIKDVYGIPDDDLLRALKGDETIDWVVDGWTSIYMLLLNMGLKFPIGGMLQKICNRLRITPSQANLNTMMILRSFNAMIEEKRIVCDVADMYATYSI